MNHRLPPEAGLSSTLRMGRPLSWWREDQNESHARWSATNEEQTKEEEQFPLIKVQQQHPSRCFRGFHPWSGRDFHNCSAASFLRYRRSLSKGGPPGSSRPLSRTPSGHEPRRSHHARTAISSGRRCLSTILHHATGTNPFPIPYGPSSCGTSSSGARRGTCRR